jgi:hypothetical protein
MSHATMLEHIKAEVDHLDAAALQSIWEIIDRAKRQPDAGPRPPIGSTPSRADKTAGANRPLQFVGENLTLEEYEHLSLKERGLLNLRLQEKNHQWLQGKFSALKAAWLVVVDGEVIASGKTLKNKPRSPQISKICQRTGKFPFIFTDDKFMLIEEGISSKSNHR